MIKEKIRAGRNQTLTLSEEERVQLSDNLFIPEKNERLATEKILNKTILSDLFDVLDYLPESFADLILFKRATLV